MKKTLLVAAGLAISASAVSAQTSCNGIVPANSDSATANAKKQAADLFQFMAPQLSEALVGGSATLGQASTLGGLGHFSVGVRVSAVAGKVPDFKNFPAPCYTNAVKGNIPTTTAPVPAPAADAIIGIFPGIPLGLTNVGGVDLIISASYIPAVDRSGVSVKVPDGSLKLGYGARVGLLSEGILVPGLSLTYLKRDLPNVNLAATTNSAQPDSLFINGVHVKTTAWRVVASKSLILFGVAAGFGQDKFDSGVDSLRASVGAPAPFGRVSGQLSPGPAQSLTRTNYFVDASLNLIVLKITGEVGQSTGGTVNTFNTFTGSQPDGSRTYASIGVRFGL